MNENIMMDDRSYLRMRRKQLGVGMQEVAEYIGISKSAISQWECYKATLSKQTIEKYYEFIDIKFNQGRTK